MSEFHNYFSPEIHPCRSTSWVQGSSPHDFSSNTKCLQDTVGFGAWDGPLLSYTISSLTGDTPTFQLPSPPISPSSDCFSTGTPGSMAPNVSGPIHYYFPAQQAPNPISMPVTNPMASMYVGGLRPPPTPAMKVEEGGYSGEQQYSENSHPQPLGPKMSQQPSARSWRTARHAHTIIERNYRDRLNTKITELSAFLFNDSVVSGIKPSKSTVISQATDRLLHLEKQNQELLAEVEALQQQVTAAVKSSGKDEADQKVQTIDVDVAGVDVDAGLDR